MPQTASTSDHASTVRLVFQRRGQVRVEREPLPARATPGSPAAAGRGPVRPWRRERGAMVAPGGRRRHGLHRHRRVRRGARRHAGTAGRDAVAGTRRRGALTRLGDVAAGRGRGGPPGANPRRMRGRRVLDLRGRASAPCGRRRSPGTLRGAARRCAARRRGVAARTLRPAGCGGPMPAGPSTGAGCCGGMRRPPGGGSSRRRDAGRRRDARVAACAPRTVEASGSGGGRVRGVGQNPLAARRLGDSELLGVSRGDPRRPRDRIGSRDRLSRRAVAGGGGQSPLPPLYP